MILKNKILNPIFGQKAVLLVFCSLLFAPCFLLYSQELKCEVRIIADNIRSQQQTDKQVFSEMENAIKDFMNNRRWTNDIYGDEEKIKCNLNIIFRTSSQQNFYEGTANFKVYRPIYGTNSETIILSYDDLNFNISYTPEDRQMVFNEQGFTSNLVANLGFLSLIALTMDYDSFGKLGGNPYLQRAFNYANIATQRGVSGFEVSQGGRSILNKYWLVENLQNQVFLPFREGFYAYHRLGLDSFTTDPATGRKHALDFLTSLKSMQAQKTQSILINSFFDAKNQELLNIFSEAPKDEKLKAFDLLKNLDPAKTELYRKLTK